mmetsp:Transcript_11979/g.17961  ORF Transcript_11979/g.17961 Transcript_11979/m.17961 type:complete len:386 (-) Transcript_11979:52-1209(-)
MRTEMKKPYVVTKLSPCFSKDDYSPSVLLARVPEEARVEVLVSSNTEFCGDEKRRQSTEIKLVSLLKAAQNPQAFPWLCGVYAAQVEAGCTTVLGQLLKTERLRPKFVPKKHSIYAWISAHEARTPAHYDDNDNALILCHGSKIVELASFSAGVTALSPLCSGSSNHALPNDKSIHFVHKIKLLPMQILYIPAGTWHKIYSEPATIAVNFWWRSTKFVDPVYHAQRSLSLELRHCIRNRFKHYLRPGSLRLALTSLNKKVRSFALADLAHHQEFLSSQLLKFDTQKTFTLEHQAFAMALWLLQDVDIVSLLVDKPQRDTIIRKLRHNRDAFARYAFRYLAVSYLFRSRSISFLHRSLFFRMRRRRKKNCIFALTLRRRKFFQSSL